MLAELFLAEAATERVALLFCPHQVCSLPVFLRDFKTIEQRQTSHCIENVSWIFGYLDGADFRSRRPHVFDLHRAVINEDQAIYPDVKRFGNADNVLALRLPVNLPSGNMF